MHASHAGTSSGVLEVPRIVGFAWLLRVGMLCDQDLRTCDPVEPFRPADVAAIAVASMKQSSGPNKRTRIFCARHGWPNHTQTRNPDTPKAAKRCSRASPSCLRSQAAWCGPCAIHSAEHAKKLLHKPPHYRLGLIDFISTP